MSKKTIEKQNSTEAQPKHRGRPKKIRTPEELAKIEEAKKNKLTLEQKQELKLKIQHEREAEKLKNNINNLNSERYYCSNPELHNKLLNWRNSDVNGVRILKLENDKLIPTEINDSVEGHEVSNSKTQYFVKISKDFSLDKQVTAIDENNNIIETTKKCYNHLLFEKAQKELTKRAGLKEFDPVKCKFYKETKNYVIHNITTSVHREGWTFNYDIVENRVIGDDIGEQILKIGKKLLNHTNFRGYTQELKEDMVSFGCYKLIKGLKNYNFKFKNPFAWISMAYWNSFLTVIFQHYKQNNIKRDLMKKLSLELASFNGIDPRSSLNKAIKQYLGEEFLSDN